MSEPFTVKLDISATAESESEPNNYILLVDPRKMRIIYEFKEWVRFLFNIKSFIQLLYEGAAIHDLEDINILSLLKCIRVERCLSVSNCNGPHLQRLLEKINKNSLNSHSEIPKLLSQKMKISLGVANEKSVQTGESGVNINSNCNMRRSPNSDMNCSHDSVNVCAKTSNSYFIPLESSTSVEGSQKSERAAQSNSLWPSASSRATDLNVSWDKSNNIADKLNNSVPSQFSAGTSCRINTVHGLGKSDIIQSNTNVMSVKDKSAKKSVHNANGELEDLLLKESPFADNDKMRKAHFKKKNFIKPFCVSDVLNALRMTSTPITDEIENKCVESPISKEVAPCGGVNCETEFEQTESSKRHKKRVRRHKSKKRTPDCNTCDISSSSMSSITLPSHSPAFEPPESKRPKHIRFDEEIDPECNSKKLLENGEDIHTGNANCYSTIPDKCLSQAPTSSEISLESLAHMLDQKRKVLKSSLLDDVENVGVAANDSESITKNGFHSDREMSAEDHDVLPTQGNSPTLDAKTDVFTPLTDNESILDELANLRNKFSTPPVFNRFA